RAPWLRLGYGQRFIGAVVMAAVWTAVTVVAVQRAGASLERTPFNVVEATIDDVQTAIRSRQITCRRLVEVYLERIKSYDKAGPALNAVQTVNPHAVEEAERLDAVFTARGPVGPLHCVSVLIKDQIDTS